MSTPNPYLQENPLPMSHAEAFYRFAAKKTQAAAAATAEEVKRREDQIDSDGDAGMDDASSNATGEGEDEGSVNHGEDEYTDDETIDTDEDDEDADKGAEETGEADNGDGDVSMGGGGAIKKNGASNLHQKNKSSHSKDKPDSKEINERILRRIKRRIKHGRFTLKTNGEDDSKNAIDSELIAALEAGNPVLMDFLSNAKELTEFKLVASLNPKIIANLKTILARNKAITTLDLCHDQYVKMDSLSVDTVLAVGEMLKTNSTLSDFTLRQNDDSSDAYDLKGLAEFKIFAEVFSTNKSLSRVTFEKLDIDDATGAAIVKALRGNTALNYLSLSEDGLINEETCDELLSLLEVNGAIKALQLWYMQIFRSPEFLIKLADVLYRNNTILDIDLAPNPTSNDSFYKIWDIDVYNFIQFKLQKNRERAELIAQLSKEQETLDADMKMTADANAKITELNKSIEEKLAKIKSDVDSAYVEMCAKMLAKFVTQDELLTKPSTNNANDDLMRHLRMGLPADTVEPSAKRRKLDPSPNASPGAQSAASAPGTPAPMLPMFSSMSERRITPTKAAASPHAMANDSSNAHTPTHGSVKSFTSSTNGAFTQRKRKL